MSQADPLARYIFEAQPLHDLLRRGVIQLSGVLLKRTIAGSRAIVDVRDRAQRRRAQARTHSSWLGTSSTPTTISPALIRTILSWRRSVSRSAASRTSCFTSADVLKTVGGEHKRVIPVHEDRLKTVFPSRVTAADLHVVELAVADGETSRVA